MKRAMRGLAIFGLCLIILLTFLYFVTIPDGAIFVYYDVPGITMPVLLSIAISLFDGAIEKEPG